MFSISLFWGGGFKMMSLDAKGIDEILLESGIITTSQMKSAWEIQRETRKEIEDILLELNYASKEDILKAKAKKLGVDFVDLSEYEYEDKKLLTLVSENLINRYVLVPISQEDGTLTVAMKDTTDIFALDDLRLASFMEIKPVMSDEEDIKRIIKKYYVHEKKVERPIVEPDALQQTSNVSGMSSQDMGTPNYSENANSSGMERGGLFHKGRIGSLFVKEGIVTEEQLELALEEQERTGEKIGQIFVKLGYMTRKTLYEFLAVQLEMPHVDLETINISDDVVRNVSENIARRYTLLPLEIDGGTMKVAMSDPMNIFSIDDMRLATGMDIVPVLGDEEQIIEILDRVFEKPQEVKSSAGEAKQKIVEYDQEIERVKEEINVEIDEFESNTEDSLDINDVENAPIVKMVNIIFSKAVLSRASDIHIEPSEDYVVVRYRVDGKLIETMKHNRKMLSALVARIKIISGLNIAEKRVPQDGRITIKIEGKSYDMRVSVLPTVFGEKIVIRIADKEGFNISKKELGFFDDDLQKFDNILSNPYGIVLVTGPTGSGKSTTLYTALKELATPDVNIMTVEDPVECTVKGINQVQVNSKAGMTFASALRAFLRQDPDIIMVGEIRDAETAEIAARSAITGHLVLSTLHTNDAASSITRMIDMGIEPFMMSSSVVGVIAQRLVRRLCPNCKEEHTPDSYEKELLGIEDGEDVKIYKPVGCETCNNTGYKGRIAIYEIMEITRELKEMIAKNVTPDELKTVAIKNGMQTLRSNCARLVKQGTTTVEELLRVTYTKE